MILYKIIYGNFVITAINKIIFLLHLKNIFKFKHI